MLPSRKVGRPAWRSMTKEKDKIKEDNYERTQCPVCMGIGSISVRGTIFKAAREICGLSRQDLADCIGVSHVTIRNVEQGVTKPQRETLELLLEEFKSRNVELDVSYSFGKD